MFYNTRKKLRLWMFGWWLWIQMLFSVFFCRIRSVIYKTFGYTNRAPLPGDTTISTPWIQKVLTARAKKQGLKVPKVKSAEIVGLDGSRGLVGAMNRVLIEYEGDSTGSPTALIMKMSRTRGVRTNVVAGDAQNVGGQREALFYASNITSSIRKGCLPEIFYSYGSHLFGEYVMLMEDLKLRNAGAVGVNLLLGNQIWGVPAEIKTRDPLPVLEMIYTRAAEIHATHWRDPALMKENWMKGVAWYKGKGRAQWEMAIQKSKEAWEIGKKRAADSQGKLKYSPKLVKIIDDSYEAASWEKLQQHLHNPEIPWTLCHGDFWAGNMFLLPGNNEKEKEEEDTLVLYDWSEVGPWEPTTDLSQMLISDVKPEIFLKHSEALAKKYWEKLIELGVSAEEYTWTNCWAAFCRGGVEKWIWFFSLLSALPMLPDNAIQYFHDQLLAFQEGFGGGKTVYVLKPVVCLA